MAQQIPAVSLRGGAGCCMSVLVLLLLLLQSRTRCLRRGGQAQRPTGKSARGGISCGKQQGSRTRPVEVETPLVKGQILYIPPPYG